KKALFCTHTNTPVVIKNKFIYQLSTISPHFLNRLTNIYLSIK
ncbi:short-chain dehydrogenase, partial [Acinetobacter baumannii]|nr:short-chain dehydrogenase [Acinetobacter baumannii]